MTVVVNHLQTPEKIEVYKEFPGTPRTLVYGDDMVDDNEKDTWDDEKRNPWWRRGVRGCPYVVLVLWCCGMILGAILVILLLAVGVQKDKNSMAALSNGTDDYYFSDVGGVDTPANDNGGLDSGGGAIDSSGGGPIEDTTVEPREFTVEGYELHASEVQRLEENGNTRYVVTGDVEMPFGNFDMTLVGVELELEKSHNERMLHDEEGSSDDDDGSIFDLINRANIQGILGSSPVFNALGPLLSGEINRTLHMSFRYASEIPFLGDMLDYTMLRQEQRFMCITLQNETFDNIPPYNRNYWLAQQYKLRNQHWLARAPESWLVISDEIPAMLLRADNLFPPVGIWDASAAVLPRKYNPRDIRWHNLTVQFDQGVLGISNLQHLFLDPSSLFGTDLYPQTLTSDRILGNSYLFGTVSIGLDVFANILPFQNDEDRRPVRLSLEGAIQAVANLDYEMLAESRNMAFMPRESLRSVAANSDIIFRLDDEGIFSSFCHLASATFHLYDHSISSSRGNGTTLALSGSGPQPENCQIGGLWDLFRIPDSLQTDFQIYSHMIVSDVEDALDVPPLVLTGQGNVFMKIINYEWELSDFSFEFIPSDFSLNIKGVLKLPVTLFGTTRFVSMQGLLDSSNSSTIHGGVAFDIKNPVTGSTFNGTIDMDILRANPIIEGSLGNPISLSGNPISLAGRQGIIPLYELVSVAHFDYCPFGEKNRCRFMSIVIDITKGGFFNLCTDIFSEEGQTCLDITNLGIFKTGVECLLSQECESGRCDGFVCKDRLEDGSACNENTDCLSRRCEGFLPGITAGTCMQKASIGAFCDENSDCAEGRCALAQCRAGEPGDVCELDSDCGSKRCVMFKCSAGEIDDPCEFNSDCVTSGRCYWNFDAVVPQGVCRQKLSDGSTCIENSECSSNRCVAFQCVAGNNGDLCLLDSDCESGRCDGFPIPKCKRKLDSGSACIQNSDCLSNKCRFGFLGSSCK